MAVGDTFQDIKTELWAIVGKPATVDQAGFEALFAGDAAKQIIGVVSIPQRGDSYEDVSEATLADGRLEHFNGVADGGALELPVKHIEGDQGLALLLANEGSNATISFMEVPPEDEGAASYFFGRIGGILRRETTTSSMRGYIAQVRVNSKRVVTV